MPACNPECWTKNAARNLCNNRVCTDEAEAVCRCRISSNMVISRETHPSAPYVFFMCTGFWSFKVLSIHHFVSWSTQYLVPQLVCAQAWLKWSLNIELVCRTRRSLPMRPAVPIPSHPSPSMQAFEAQTISITSCAVTHAVALFVSIRAEESRRSIQTPRMLRPCHSRQSQGCEQKVLVSSRGKGTS